MRIKITILLILNSILTFSQIDLKKELMNFDVLKIKDLRIISTDTAISKNEKMFITHFNDHNVKSGFIIWENRNQAFKPLWFQLDSSDFPPHTFTYIDFNQDGKLDFLILSGREDYFNTRAYINNSTNHFSLENFELKYENRNCYSSLVDINNDGICEILDSGISGDEHKESKQFFYTEKQKTELENKYDSITKIHCNNFTYNLPEYFKIINSFISNKIIIFQFINGKFLDNTKNYKHYIEWRIHFLTELKNDPRNDKKLIDDIITYLNNKI